MARVKSSIEDERNKQSNSENQLNLTKETWKIGSEMKPPLLGEAGEYSRPSKVVQKSCQQTFPGPAPKEGTRKKIDVVNPDDAETKPNRKKTDTTSGKLFRTLSLDKLLNVAGEKKKHNAGEKSQLPSNT